MRTQRDPPPIGTSHTVPSRLTIRQHPIHPMLVIYPVAFLSTMVFADLSYAWLQDPFWARLAFLLNTAGFVAGVLAAAVGLADLFLVREVRRHVSAWNHFLAGVMVLALAGAGTMMRWQDPVQASWPWGLLLSGATFVMVAVTGWLGGTLSFKYGIGVYGRDEAEARAQSDDAPPAG